MRQLHDSIVFAAPGLKPVLITSMSKPMIGYGMTRYTNKSGKVQDWPVIALANQKNHLSLYISALEDGQYVAEKYADQLGRVSVGKSCIRFKKLSDLNLDLVKEIATTLQTRLDRGEVVYGF